MKINRLLAIAVFFFFSNHTFAQGFNWQWARGSSGNVEVSAVATDKDGNAIIAGSFELCDSIVFSPYTFYPFTSSGRNFLVKYSPGGQVLWVLHLPLADESMLVNLATDPYGNIFTSGETAGTLYLMKVSSSGSLIWVDSTGGVSHDFEPVATDLTGNAYYTGAFNGTSMVFGHDTIAGATGNFSPFDNYFVAKYSPSGTALWARSVVATTNGRLNTSQGTALATDMNNNLIAGGNFGADSLIVGTIVTHGPHLSLYYTVANSFVAKYDSTGHPLWAKTLSSISTLLSSVCTDPYGNVYAYGTFSDSLFVDNTLVLKRPEGSSNIFLIKFDAGGGLLWSIGSNRINGTGGPFSYSVASYRNDHVLITGGSFDSFSWTTDSINYSYYPTGGPNDKSFILMLDTAGHIKCGQIFNQGGDDANGLAVDPSGYVYWAGDHWDPTFVIGTDTLRTGQQQEGAYLAKFIPCGEIVNGVETITTNVALQIYPNPLSSTATVKYDLMQDAATASLVITDMLGRVRSTYPISTPHGEVSIDITGLGSGVYFYTLIVDGNNIATKKMVVE